MKIVLAIASLGGGAERVMMLLANSWVGRDNEVALITVASNRMDRYPLDPAVHRIALDVADNSAHVLAAIGHNIVRICALRRAIAVSQPNAMISFIAESNVRGAMRGTDLFMLSSRCEGFPNALLEAMTEGRACVSFDCDAGPRELIDHGRNGWLVPTGDVHALTDALDTQTGDADLRAQLGRRACDVSSTYSLATILDQWNEPVTSVLPQNPVRALPR
ncbi:MAG: glycosyltransferase [Rhodanobacteraceae bacterium]